MTGLDGKEPVKEPVTDLKKLRLIGDDEAAGFSASGSVYETVIFAERFEICSSLNGPCAAESR